MNFVSRTITGIVMSVLGLGLIIVSPWLKFISLFYGIPLLIIGIFILLNRGEDKIEQIKFRGGKK